MKNFTIFLILAIFMAISVNLSAQTKQQSKAVQKIESEMTALRYQLASVDHQINKLSTSDADTLPMWQEKKRLDAAISAGNMTLEKHDAYINQSQRIADRLKNERAIALKVKKENSAAISTLQSQRPTLETRIKQLEADRMNIINVQINEAYKQDIPRELNRTETKRRYRSNGVRSDELSLESKLIKVQSEDIQLKREELGITKLDASKVIADPVNGYFGKVFNWSKKTDYQFKIYDVDKKIEVKNFIIKAQSVEPYYLLPGNYVCEVYTTFGELAGTYSFPVSPQLQRVSGEDLHWAVWQTVDYRSHHYQR